MSRFVDSDLNQFRQAIAKGLGTGSVESEPVKHSYS
jgi:hypothetical protein